MNNPLVSVIIATYNGKEKWFTQTIESVLNQTYKNIEIIVINDASTNNIEDVILKYQKKYSSIFYIKNKKNLERSYSRNKGIFESKGKYIAFLDDDDIWSDYNKIKKQIEFFEKNSDYVLCGTSMVRIDGNNNKIESIIAKEEDDEIRKIILQGSQFGFAFSSVMIRKDVLCLSGLFNSNYNFAEDYELWLRIGKYGKIHNINNSFISYRTWQGNTTTTTSKLKQKNLAFKAMILNGSYYPNFLKAIFIRALFYLPQKLLKPLVKVKHMMINRK